MEQTKGLAISCSKGHMKTTTLIPIVVVLLLMTGIVEAEFYADTFDIDTIGLNWSDPQNLFNISNGQFNFFTNTGSYPTILKSVNLSSSNYTINVTYIDQNTSYATDYFDIFVNLQSYTLVSSSMQGLKIEFRENSLNALAYFANGTYTSTTTGMGQYLVNGTVISITISSGTNASISLNGTYKGYLNPAVWVSSSYKNGTVGFGGTNTNSNWSKSMDDINISNIILGTSQYSGGNPGDANVYYISPSGSNSNNGTSIENAWRNFSYAINVSGTGGSGKLGANKTLYIIDGIYYETSSAVIREAYHNCGNSTNKLTITAWNYTPIIKIISNKNVMTLGSSTDNFCQNVTISNISFQGPGNTTDVWGSLLWTATKMENFTLSNNIFSNTTNEGDGGQISKSKNILIENNTFKGYIGMNAFNILNCISSCWLINNTYQDIYNIYAHGAVQHGGSGGYSYDFHDIGSQFLNETNVGGWTIYNWNNGAGLSPWSSSNFEFRNFSMINANPLQVYMGRDGIIENGYIDIYDLRLHPIYIKGIPYYTLDNPDNRTSNITFKNITFKNHTNGYWTVRLEGGDGIRFQNITFLTQKFSNNAGDDGDYMIRGYNQTLESQYPNPIIIQDTNNSIFRVRAEFPYKIQINYTSNNIFNVIDDTLYPRNYSTSLSCSIQNCSQTFWNYSSSGRHRFNVSKLNIYVRPLSGNVTISNSTATNFSINYQNNSILNLNLTTGSEFPLTNWTLSNLTAGNYVLQNATNTNIVTKIPESKSVTFSNLQAGEYWIEAASTSELPSTPPIPTLQSNLTGNFFVDTIWQTGNGNVTTDGFNVTNGTTWFNGTATNLLESKTPHGWSNLTILAWNHTGAGNLSNGSLIVHTQIPNNVPIQALIGDKDFRGSYLNISTSTIDADGDVLTYATNASLGTLVSNNYSYLIQPANVAPMIWEFNSSDGYGGVASEVVSISASPIDSTRLYQGMINRKYQNDTIWHEGTYSSYAPSALGVVVS